MSQLSLEWPDGCVCVWALPSHSHLGKYLCCESDEKIQQLVELKAVCNMFKRRRYCGGVNYLKADWPPTFRRAEPFKKSVEVTVYWGTEGHYNTFIMNKSTCFFFNEKDAHVQDTCLNTECAVECMKAINNTNWCRGVWLGCTQRERDVFEILWADVIA